MPSHINSVVFLHGFLGSKQDFKELIPLLESHFNCYSFDLPGHGLNPLSGAPSFDRFLEAIKNKLSEEKITKCHLIGYSMGGRLSLLFAEKYPDLVEKLVIISSHLGLDSKKEKENRFNQDLEWAKKMQESPMEDFLKEWYEQPLFDSLREKKEIFEDMRARRTNLHAKPLAKILPALSVAKQKSFWQGLESFKQEILFICGEKDEKYQALYKKIPLSPKRQMKCLSETGHAPHLEKPTSVAEVIIPFLRVKE